MADSRPIAVIDIETTGISPTRHHRIVEIAVVTVLSSGDVVDEFATLVNPRRDVGASEIHGIRARDLVEAPEFRDVVGELSEILSRCVAFAGHNVRFERDFLKAEYQRVSAGIPSTPALCTMTLACRAGGVGTRNLAGCCDAFGIDLPAREHSALDDARATAQLLAACLRRHPEPIADLPDEPLVWPVFQRGARPPIRREVARHRRDNPDYLERLVARLEARPGTALDADRLAYLALLDRCLEDRFITQEESEDLLYMASHWGLSPADVQAIHRDYLQQLCAAALADGIVTDAERSDLAAVAKIFGQSADELGRLLGLAEQRVAQIPVSRDAVGLEGKTVCFTGELQSCLAGEPISREKAQELAKRAGMIPVASVTKKLDLLVVADIHTLSGKARKARDQGIRIIAEGDFWQRIDVQVDL